jgi:anti-sigma-K factor RskA
MTSHEQFAENLALYALRALEGEERAAMEKHLEDCAACRNELLELQGDMALLALTSAGPAPPERAKRRLMEAIAQEPRAGRPQPESARSVWWTFVPAFAAAIVAVFAFLIWQENTALQSEIATMQSQMARDRQRIAHLEPYRRVAEVLTAPEAAHFTLVDTRSKPVPQGRAIYLEKRGGLVFVASNLNPIPAGKTYELWLLPAAAGAAPIPAGLFKPDARGSATVLAPPLPAGIEAKGFAVTIENEGGSQTPTMPIVMAGM